MDKTTETSEMRTVYIQAYPYASLGGRMRIPNGLTPDKENEYISTHWNKFIPDGEPDLDYEGTDFEYFEDDEND